MFKVSSQGSAFGPLLARKSWFPQFRFGTRLLSEDLRSISLDYPAACQSSGLKWIWALYIITVRIRAKTPVWKSAPGCKNGKSEPSGQDFWSFRSEVWKWKWVPRGKDGGKKKKHRRQSESLPTQQNIKIYLLFFYSGSEQSHKDKQTLSAHVFMFMENKRVSSLIGHLSECNLSF